MDNALELARTRVTIRHLAENLDMSEAEKLLLCLRESTVFLERRITREKLDVAEKGETVVHSQSVRPS